MEFNGKTLIRIIREELYKIEEAENWMKGAVKRPGALSKRLGIPEKDNIPISRINSELATLNKKSKGNKKLSKDDLLFLRQLNFAKAAKGISKKK